MLMHVDFSERPYRFRSHRCIFTVRLLTMDDNDRMARRTEPAEKDDWNINQDSAKAKSCRSTPIGREKSCCYLSYLRKVWLSGALGDATVNQISRKERQLSCKPVPVSDASHWADRSWCQLQDKIWFPYIWSIDHCRLRKNRPSENVRTSEHEKILNHGVLELTYPKPEIDAYFISRWNSGAAVVFRVVVPSQVINEGYGIRFNIPKEFRWFYSTSTQRARVNTI